jgi:DNA-binding PadR family transcriptional regulator
MRPIDDENSSTSPRGPFGRGQRGPRFGAARQHHGAGFPGREHGDHEHGRGGRGGRGFGPGFGGPGFGGGFGGGFGPGFGPGRERRRRGDVRLAILGLLAEGPQNGYAVIKTIAERTGGAWKPSPGSVYPTLQQLVDEELVVSTGDGRKTLFELTDAGRTEAGAKADEIAAAWESTPGMPDSQRELFESLRKLASVMHVFRTSATDEQTKAATEKIDGLRRDLLQVLSD